MGKYFKSIKWLQLDDRQMDQLSRYCENVVELQLVAPDLQLDSIKRNEIWFKNIECLKIVYGDDVYDIHVNAAVVGSTKLKCLELINCPNVQGKFLSEWKESKLEYLRMIRCEGLSASNITDFQHKNQLAVFASDTFDSFITCLTLPAGCLKNFTDLELAVNSSTDDKLALLEFDELTQLKKIHLKCTFFNYRVDQDVTVAKNFNNIFDAMRPIDTLISVTIDHIIVDADTFKSLESIKNLRELNLKNIYSAVGQEIYASLHVHLPKLTDLTMSVANTDEQIDAKSICDMVSGLVDLKYFSHLSMTWALMKMIRDARIKLYRKQPPITIGLPRMMFYSQTKVRKFCITIRVLLLFFYIFISC